MPVTPGRRRLPQMTRRKIRATSVGGLRNGSGEGFHVRYQGYAVPVPPRPALSRPWFGTHPSEVLRSIRSTPLVVPGTPCRPLCHKWPYHGHVEFSSPCILEAIRNYRPS
jgi:hypothetical protein